MKPYPHTVTQHVEASFFMENRSLQNSDAYGNGFRRFVGRFEWTRLKAHRN